VFYVFILMVRVAAPRVGSKHRGPKREEYVN
jgi:hypothetical protein